MVKLKHIHFGNLEMFLECITKNSGYKAVVEVSQDKEEIPHYDISILTKGEDNE